MNLTEAQAVKSIYFDRYPEIDMHIDHSTQKPRIYVSYPELIREKRECRFDGKVKRGEFSPEWEKYFHAGDLILLRRCLRIVHTGFVLGTRPVKRQKKFLRDGKRPTMNDQETALIQRLLRKQ